MKAFFSYFFGAGETQEFYYFSFAHFLPILLAAGVIYLIFRYRKQLAAVKNEKNIRLAMAFICIVTEMSYFWRLVGVPALDANPQDHLPITVCGWALIFCSYLAVSKNQTLYDIAYFWLFSGTLFALVTPAVLIYCGPTRFRFYQFWLEHTMGYIVIFYMTFVHGMRPHLKSIFKSIGALAVLTTVAIVANTVIGGEANYLFLATTEDGASVLDILPSSLPLKLLVMGALVILLFGLAYLPWYLIDRKAKQKALASEAEAQTEAESQTEAKTPVAK